MSAAEPVEMLSDRLALMGIQLMPEHLSQVLGWIPVLGAAAFTLWGVLAKIRADQRTSIVDHQRGYIELLQRDLKAASERASAEEHAKDAAEKERDELRDENRVLLGVSKDQSELIVSMSRDLKAQQAHINGGNPPPPPDFSWRTLDYLNPRKET